MRRRLSRSLTSARCAAVAVLAGCAAAANAPAEPPVAAGAGACVVVDGVTATRALSVAVAGPLRVQNAPLAANAAERLVFRQVYETLVHADCEGRAVPALAGSWTRRAGGRIWEFELRADARFLDGAPVTAQDVVAFWTMSRPAAAVIAHARAATDRTLMVELHGAVEDAAAFADDRLAVARPAGRDTWPLGTGYYRADAVRAGSVRLAVAGRYIAIVNDPAQRPPALEFRTYGTDPRSALDAGADVLVTADPAVLRYARVLPGYETTPLNWSRTYVLITRSAAVANAVDVLPGSGEDVRDARPLDWLVRTCADAALPAPPRAGAGTTGRIVYAADDPLAREIAERITALAWPPGRAPAWLARALSSEEVRQAPAAVAADEPMLVSALRTGDALALVLPLPRTGVVWCDAFGSPQDALLRELLRDGAWQITPLLEARDRMVHRGFMGRIAVGADGTLIFGGAR